MFLDLHALAQSATLLLVISAEGDQLRVSVTPTQAGDKEKPHSLRPLTLLGTPAELDSDFGAALIAWQGPKQSLVEQAQAQAGAVGPDGAAKVPAKSEKAEAKGVRGKPGPKKKDAAPVNEEPEEETNQLPKAPADDALELSRAEAIAPSEEAVVIEPPAPAAAPVDTLTMNLF